MVFTCQDCPIKHRIAGYLNEADIRWELVALLDDNDISWYKIECRDADMRAITNDDALIGQHCSNRGHDPTRAPVLPGVESSLDEPDSDQNTGKRQIGNGRWLAERSPSDEDENSGNEKDGAEAAEEISCYLPEQTGRWRCHLVAAILANATLDLVV